MAAFNKVGIMLRNSISASSAMNGQSSMFNAIRCMSSKIFVGGLSYGTNDEGLKEAFSNFGDVDSAKVIMDRESGRSKGFGFVEFSNEEGANAAVQGMDGQELNGRNIRVSIAQERERAPRSNYGGGGGYGGGGYGNRNDSY